MATSALRDLPMQARNARRANIGQVPYVRPDTSGQDLTGELLNAGSIAMSPVPVVGDILGLAADARMYQTDPASRTMGNYGMTLAGVLPFVPGAAAVRSAKAIEEAAKRGLDMSQGVRMQRATEQGFSPEIVYHGTGKDFDAFDPAMSGGSRYNTGIFMSQSPDVASTYALGQEKQVLPLMYRTESPMQVFADKANWNKLGPNTRVELPARTVNQSEDADILRALGIETGSTREMLPSSSTLRQLFPDVYQYEDDFIDTNEFARWAKRQGADAVIFNDIVDRGPAGMFSNEKALNPSRNITIFNPANIRSVNAAFDPTKRSSANLMAGVAGGAVGLSALRNINNDEQPSK